MKKLLISLYILFLFPNLYSQSFFDSAQVLFSNDSLVIQNIKINEESFWGKWDLNYENADFNLADYGTGEYPYTAGENNFFSNAEAEFNGNDLNVQNINVENKNYSATWSFNMTNANFNIVSVTEDKNEDTEVSEKPFTLSSLSFSSGSTIPLKYVCSSKGGQDISPQLSWTNVPSGTKYFAIIMDDPDAQSVCGYTWVHWFVINIPVNITSIDENASAAGMEGEQIKNDFGVAAYGGPCPPNGTHKYYIKIFALNNKIEGISSPLTIEEFQQQYSSYIIDSVSIYGVYP